MKSCLVEKKNLMSITPSELIFFKFNVVTIFNHTKTTPPLTVYLRETLVFDSSGT